MAKGFNIGIIAAKPDSNFSTLVIPSDGHSSKKILAIHIGVKIENPNNEIRNNIKIQNTNEINVLNI